MTKEALFSEIINIKDYKKTAKKLGITKEYLMVLRGKHRIGKVGNKTIETLLLKYGCKKVQEEVWQN